MAKTATKVRKKIKKNVAEGIAHVHASFNNTIITITDRQGNALSWATSGGAVFKGRHAAGISHNGLNRAGNSDRRCNGGPEPGPVRNQAAAAFLAAFLRGLAAVLASALGAAAFLATFLRPFGSGAASADAARSVSMTSAIGAQSPARYPIFRMRR